MTTYHTTYGAAEPIGWFWGVALFIGVVIVAAFLSVAVPVLEWREQRAARGTL